MSMSTSNASVDVQTASMNEDSSPSRGSISQSSSQESISLDSGTREINRELFIKRICHVVIGSPLPFTSCEDSAFGDMMRALNPQTQALIDELDSKTLEREVMKVCNAEKEIVVDELAKAPGRISFTFDIWENEMEGQYLCLIAYWIDSNWKLQRRMISFVASDYPFVGPYIDGPYVAEEVAKFLTEWKVDKKAMTLTLANPNETMIVSLKTHLLSSRSLLCNGDFFQVRCVSEVITFAVESGLKLIEDLLGTVSGMVCCIRTSLSKKKNFYEIAEKKFHLCTKKRLRPDFVRSWYARFTMIDRVLYFKPVFDHLMESDEEFKMYELSDDDWEELDLVHKFLKIFYDVPNQYMSSKQPTSNVYFKEIWEIQRKLVEASKEPHYLMLGTVKVVKEMFDKYWSDHNLILSCAAVLDPRCKLEFVEYCHDKLYGEDYAKDMVQKVKTTLYTLFDDYETFSRKGQKLGNEKSQLDFYLEEQNLEQNKDIDLLSYWQNLSNDYPELASMARDILVIPIFSVPPEAAFGMGKKMIKYWQCLLAPETIQATVCCQDWLHQKGSFSGMYEIFSAEMEDSDLEDEFEEEQESDEMEESDLEDEFEEEQESDESD